MNEAGNNADGALIVQLEVHLGREPVSGRMRTEQGEVVAFVGWLGFAEALHRLEATSAEDPRWEEA